MKRDLRYLIIVPSYRYLLYCIMKEKIICKDKCASLRILCGLEMNLLEFECDLRIKSSLMALAVVTGFVVFLVYFNLCIGNAKLYLCFILNIRW